MRYAPLKGESVAKAWSQWQAIIYSVPNTARHQIVEVQHHTDKVWIFEEGQLIARLAFLEGKKPQAYRAKSPQGSPGETGRDVSCDPDDANPSAPSCLLRRGG